MRNLPALMLILLFLSNSCSTAQEPWMLGFEKPATNPIMQADSTAIFLNPIDQQVVQWQKADVFNPGAIVRNDTIFLLFRAEDNPAAILGGRTSRIGLAYSTDGINFDKLPDPVLFPDNDEFAKWDHPGRC